MGTQPLVSIIVPVYNAQSTIGETLDSILAQTYGNLEIIVVDDGSTDETAQIVRCYEPRVLYSYQKNSGGASVPRNTGIERSSGEFLCFIDADDLMLPDRIARQIDFMERYPSVGTVFCDYRNYYADGCDDLSHFQTCPLLWDQLKDKNELVIENAFVLLAQENFGISGSFLIRKSALISESGYEPSLKACEDFHFYYRLTRHAPTGVINNVGMMRRLNGQNMSDNEILMLSEGIRCRTLLRNGEQDARSRALLSRYIAECQTSLSCYFADHGHYERARHYAWEALYSDFGFHQALATCKSVARTVLIAIGMHRP